MPNQVLIIMVILVLILAIDSIITRIISTSSIISTKNKKTYNKNTSIIIGGLVLTSIIYTIVYCYDYNKDKEETTEINVSEQHEQNFVEISTNKKKNDILKKCHDQNTVIVQIDLIDKNGDTKTVYAASNIPSNKMIKDADIYYNCHEVAEWFIDHKWSILADNSYGNTYRDMYNNAFNIHRSEYWFGESHSEADGLYDYTYMMYQSIKDRYYASNNYEYDVQYKFGPKVTYRELSNQIYVKWDATHYINDIESENTDAYHIDILNGDFDTEKYREYLKD